MDAVLRGTKWATHYVNARIEAGNDRTIVEKPERTRPQCGDQGVLIDVAEDTESEIEAARQTPWLKPGAMMGAVQRKLNQLIHRAEETKHADYRVYHSGKNRSMVQLVRLGADAFIEDDASSLSQGERALPTTSGQNTPKAKGSMESISLGEPSTLSKKRSPFSSSPKAVKPLQKG